MEFKSLTDEERARIAKWLRAQADEAERGIMLDRPVEVGYGLVGVIEELKADTTNEFAQVIAAKLDALLP